MKLFIKFFLSAFLFCLVLTSSVSFVSAAPSVTQIQQFAEGYIIEGTPQEILKQNQDFQYNFFLYNISNGKQISNLSTKCMFYLANSSGTIKTFISVPYYQEGYWGLVLSAGNFSTLGHHPYGIKCNSSALGGAYVSYFEVTATGTTPSSIFDNQILLIFFTLSFALIISGAFLKVSAFGFLGSLLLMLLGIYMMIYGFDNVTDLYTRAASAIIISMGFIFMIISAWEWMPWVREESMMWEE